MKVLIIGYGSAGKRHSKILNNEKKIKKIFIKTKQNLKSSKKIFFVKNIKNINPDLIVICSETSKHHYHCKLVEKKFNKKIVLVEKPIFNKFIKFIAKKNKFFITYNLRFHPILKYLKLKIIKNKIFYIEAETSSYLPFWRKNSDYQKSYSAFASKGGGTLLDLSHEIDYVRWLEPKFKPYLIISKKISDLNISSNDISLILGKINNNGLVKIKMTYFNKYPRRYLSICFKNGSQVYADLLKSQLKIINKKKTKNIKFKKFSQYQTTKEMYKEVLNRTYKNLCTLKEGLDLLNLIKIKKN